MTGDPAGAAAFARPAAVPAALTELELAELGPGDVVLVRRFLPASSDRASQVQQWRVAVAAMVRWPGENGWSLVPAESHPAHPLDFHLGATGDGLLTSVGPCWLTRYR